MFEFRISKASWTMKRSGNITNIVIIIPMVRCSVRYLTHCQSRVVVV